MLDQEAIEQEAINEESVNQEAMAEVELVVKVVGVLMGADSNACARHRRHGGHVNVLAWKELARYCVIGLLKHLLICYGPLTVEKFIDQGEMYTYTFVSFLAFSLPCLISLSLK